MSAPAHSAPQTCAPPPPRRVDVGGCTECTRSATFSFHPRSLRECLRTANYPTPCRAVPVERYACSGAAAGHKFRGHSVPILTQRNCIDTCACLLWVYTLCTTRAPHSTAPSKSVYTYRLRFCAKLSVLAGRSARVSSLMGKISVHDGLGLHGASGSRLRATGFRRGITVR